MQNALGPPVAPFCPFLGQGSPTKIDYTKKGTLILASLLEDLVFYLRLLCGSISRGSDFSQLQGID